MEQASYDSDQQREETLSVSQTQFQVLVDQVPLGIYLVDAHFRIRVINPIARPVFGAIPQLIGRDFDQVMHILWEKEYADELVRLFRHTLETGQPYATSRRIEQRHDRGQQEYYEWQIIRIGLSEGGYGVVCYFRDISEKIVAEQTIQQSLVAFHMSEERRQLAIEGANIFTWEVNPKTNEVKASSNVSDVLGFEMTTDAPENFLSIHPDDSQRVRAALDQAFQGQVPLDIEHRIINPQSGAIIWVKAQGQLLTSQPGTPLVFMGITQNITPRKQAEEALMEADRRKTEFLALLAHELRNPLAPLRHTLEFLQLTTGQDPALGASVALMNRQVDQLVHLVDDLLDISRISQGKLQLRPERVDLTALIRQTVEAAFPHYEQGGRILSVTLPLTPLILLGDPTRLIQVVSNLLTNAAKFTNESGQVWLSLETGEREAVLHVRDNGVGIVADQVDSIFEMFRQVDTSLSRSQGGLGLGLTLVKELVELHGGRVEVQSEGLGQGSEFRVYLPILADTPPPALPIHPGSGKVNRVQRILVVDDNQDAALTLARLLQIKGYEVHTCYDGLAGVADSERLGSEVVLLDISMPGLDGYETCRLIRAQPWGQSLHLVALTGYGQEEDKRLSEEAGFEAHLVKPVNLSALLELLISF